MDNYTKNINFWKSMYGADVIEALPEIIKRELVDFQNMALKFKKILKYTAGTESDIRIIDTSEDIFEAIDLEFEDTLDSVIKDELAVIFEAIDLEFDDTVDLIIKDELEDIAITLNIEVDEVDDVRFSIFEAIENLYSENRKLKNKLVDIEHLIGVK